MDGVTEGRFVHYVIKDGEHRAALIVRGWGKPGEAGSEHPNLYVFLDGGNDNWNSRDMLTIGMLWRTSVPYDEDTKKPGTWHWPERV